MIVDELRIIHHTNTQVRYLPIISQILRTIGSRSYSLTVLKDVMTKWSIAEESTSSIYQNHNGILTDKGKPTTAFNFYIELMINLGLITRINEVVRSSKYGSLFITLEKYFHSTEPFSDLEKIYFYFFILLKDADNIILMLQMLVETPCDSVTLRGKYESILKERLKIKSQNASPFSRNHIFEKLRKVEYEWKNAKEYSKHIIPPRLEWLLDLGYISFNLYNDKKFQTTELGRKFYLSLNTINDSQTRDVNDSWLMNCFVNNIKPAINSTNYVEFDVLTENQRIELLHNILPVLYKDLDSDGIRRISTLPFYLYIMIVGLLKYKVIIPFNMIRTNLNQSIVISNYTYAFRDASRINESYIAVSIVK